MLYAHKSASGNVLPSERGSWKARKGGGGESLVGVVPFSLNSSPHHHVLTCSTEIGSKCALNYEKLKGYLCFRGVQMLGGNYTHQRVPALGKVRVRSCDLCFQ